MKIELQSIKNFLKCKESIIRIEISRYLLKKASGGMSKVIFNRLWLETDVLLSEEVDKLRDMFTDNLRDWEVTDQILRLIADRIKINSLIYPNNNIVPVEAIVNYVEQDLEEKLH